MRVNILSSKDLFCCSDLRLVIVLQRHGDDVDANDQSDEEVQVVAGA